NIANFKDLRNNTPLAESALQKLSRSFLASQVEGIQYVCSDYPFLLLFDRAVEFARGKDLIVWSHHPAAEKEAFKVSPYMNYSVLDATLRLSHGKTAPLNIDEWAQLINSETKISQVARKYLVSHRVSTQAKISHGINKIRNKLLKEDAPDFAFIVHALSHKELMFGPGLSLLKNMPEKFNDSFDRLAAQAPAFVYGKVRHVISKDNGREINGIVYALPITPKLLKAAPPEEIYAKIEKICYDAANRGAKIIGLGAYTKIIGDSGVTINRNSPIPVTTGNSLSASSTLWALADVVKKMKLLNMDPNTGLVNGMAMVIGATGSIGQVSAKLLALTFNRVCLVAPRQNRLDELAQEIRAIAPKCEITTSTNANAVAGIADVLVTATSSVDEKIVDVERLKPGCVVCDCSRPLDFDLEDAKKRPDVLIIESGEVNLPGPVDINFNMGLPGNTVYACLAETALLALEGRYESFTMGRDIEWNKVKQIYKMARKHGVELAAIQGHMGIVSDKEIALTKSLALSRLSSSSGKKISR
ncbi:MAG: dehydrogenase, partial [Bdellovibrionaceae bacterium]|nr:dehydrogenase [Pseudobdellovibrionaceae bacterium]